MPGGNNTGPMGMGPRTGRGMGYCTGHDRPGFAQSGCGFGHGRGWRHRAYTTGHPGWQHGPYAPGWWGTYPTAPDEATVLKTQAEQLQTQLDAIQQRLTELENK